MMGRGLGLQHRGGSGQSSVPVVGLDYFFIISGGIKKKSELIEDGITEEGIDTAREQGEIIKCLIIRCAKFEYLTAHCVPCKGADE